MGKFRKKSFKGLLLIIRNLHEEDFPHCKLARKTNKIKFDCKPSHLFKQHLYQEF